MPEWVSVAIWVALILLLGVIEIFTLDFIFLMLAAGSAVGLIATVVGAPWWLALVIAAAFALILIALVRPSLLRALGRGADPHRTGIAGIIGTAGTVTVPFRGETPGQVKLANGETWSARLRAVPASTQTPPPGTDVVVDAVEGSLLIVHPRERKTTA